MGKPQLSKDNFGQSEKKDAYSLKQIDNGVPNNKSRNQTKSEIIPSMFWKTLTGNLRYTPLLPTKY